jgi:hypothetical protein
MSKLRDLGVAVAGLAVLSACDDESSDSGMDPRAVGYFQTSDADLAVEEVSPGKFRHTRLFRRVTGLPDVSGISACTYAEGEEAVSVVFTYNLQKNGTYEAVGVYQLAGGGSCAVHASGRCKASDGIMILSGQELRYSFSDGDQVCHLRQLRSHAAAKEGEDLLFTGDEFDWLFGTWRLIDNPEETLQIGRDPRQVVRRLIRHIGGAYDNVPDGTVCDYVQVGRKPHVFAHVIDGETRYFLEYRLVEMRLNGESADDPICRMFREYELADLDEERGEVRLLIAKDGENLVVDGTNIYTKAG